LLHVNLTIKMVDPTAGNPGAGRALSPGDNESFSIRVWEMDLK
jgi:hypothetical protein